MLTGRIYIFRASPSYDYYKLLLQNVINHEKICASKKFLNKNTYIPEGPHYKIFSIVPNGLVPRGMSLTAVAELQRGGVLRPLRQLSKVSCSKDVGSVPFFFHLVGVVKKGS